MTLNEIFETYPSKDYVVSRTFTQDLTDNFEIVEVEKVTVKKISGRNPNGSYIFTGEILTFEKMKDEFVIKCDYRNPDCTNNGITVNGKWVCSNHFNHKT